MNEIEYKKRCDALFQKAKMLRLELLFEPNDFNPQRLNCLWYGGKIAEVKVYDKLSIEISVWGDVYADLFDRNGRHIAHVKDKGNMAVFAREMEPHLKNDAELAKAVTRGRLRIECNNWIEYNGLIREKSCQSGQKLIDLGIICDNLLDDNILIAIDEVLESYQNIVSEIRFAVKEDYGMPGGEAA